MNTRTIDSPSDEQLRAAVSQVINLAGGQTELARILQKRTGRRIQQSTVAMWLIRGRVPHNWVIPCEIVLDGKLQRYDIRPDLHPRAHPGYKALRKRP